MGTRGTAFELPYQKLRHIAKMQAATEKIAAQPYRRLLC